MRNKVLIADASELWRETLARELEQTCQVVCCADGAETLVQIDAFGPDVVILDLMLSRVDALSVLRKVCARSRRPRFIVTGKYISDYVHAALARMRVEIVIPKPCSASGVADRVAELTEGARSVLRRVDPFDEVTALLLALNVPTNQRGFRYLREGILLLMADPDQQLTKSLYPAIARRYDTSPTNVEKCIRTTVHAAWNHRREELWRQYFAPAARGVIPRPTSGLFLRRMVDVMSVTSQRQA